MTRTEAWWRWSRKWRREHLFANVDRTEVLAHVDEAGELGPRYAFMTLMSAGIAMLGLLQGSGAVIIGAMLISPLMGPIVEMGMALATFELRTLRSALRTMAVGVVLAVGICFAIVWMSPLQEPTAEIIARTEPTLFDLLVAIFSGLAGAYATITRKGETIVGVAIATALMPPLAVVGYGLAVGNWQVAGGASFLFMTNLLAIALSVTIMARWYGFGAGDTPKQSAFQAGLIIGAFLLLSIPLGLALRDIAARTLAQSTVRSTLEAAAREGGGRITTLRVDAGGKTIQVDAVLLTPEGRPDLAPRLERTLEDRLGRPVTVQLQEVHTADMARLQREQSTLSELRNSVAELQTAATRDAASREAHDAALIAMRQRALGHFGTLEVLDGGRAARWQLAPDAGLDLVAAHALERDLNAVPAATASAAAGRDAARPLQVRVLPALQPLPRIGFADDSAELTPRQLARIDAIAWALRRWQAGALDVVGHAGGDPGLARSRTDAVAAALRARGAPVAATTVADAEQTREQIREAGIAAGRSVVVQLATTASE
ncbi:DUF389 domain-containing protein [Luteimonas vadosa]|uniref:DUF389 domain-containing protein n=1 Tax=Luteimonas vadosa TaxID=1165507 RepID=A0ABP9DTR6_9GAMM